MLSAPALLTQEHRLDAFASGEPSLDEWLKRRALANQTSGASRTFVVCDAGLVVAYYSLATGAVSMKEAPGRFRRNMPDPIPIVLLARLAVAETHRLGRALFQDAARRVVAAADAIGLRGLLVHALTKDAAAFYRHLGLYPSPLDSQLLMVTVADLRASLRS
jgi:hypothetical protein